MFAAELGHCSSPGLLPVCTVIQCKGHTTALTAQVVDGLRACHSTGIVHRDVKPQNVIVCGEDQCAKMIDLGAAADLRVGINYVPNEFLLDPRYAPPEQYIMSTQVISIS